jgi:hypothetical protein
MDENEWLKATDPGPMLEFLRGKVSDRKLRLFAVACCRRTWHLLTSEPGKRVVELAEKYADHGVTASDLLRANVRAFSAEVYVDSSCAGGVEGWRAAVESSATTSDAVYSTTYELQGGAKAISSLLAEREAQASLLRDIVANPFATPWTIDSACLRWNDGTVVRIATEIYEERAFERMGVLADALLDSGCDDENLLAHCREQKGVHTRGCWVIDLVLGKE